MCASWKGLTLLLLGAPQAGVRLCRGGSAPDVPCAGRRCICESGQSGIFHLGPSSPPQRGGSGYQGYVLKNCVGLAPGPWPRQHPGFVEPLSRLAGAEDIGKGRFSVLWSQTACLGIWPLPLISSVTLGKPHS